MNKTFPAPIAERIGGRPGEIQRFLVEVGKTSVDVPHPNQSGRGIGHHAETFLGFLETCDCSAFFGSFAQKPENEHQLKNNYDRTHKDQQFMLLPSAWWTEQNNGPTRNPRH